MGFFSRRTTFAQGQAMLIAVLILAALMLSLSLVGSLAFLRETQGLVAVKNKKTAEVAATACMEQAINSLGRNATYAGNETVTIGSITCTIRPVTSSGTTWTLQTQSQIGDQYARFQVVLSTRAPVTISSWDEVALFGP